MSTAPRRIDVHQHLVPFLYRDTLSEAGDLSGVPGATGAAPPGGPR